MTTQSLPLTPLHCGDCRHDQTRHPRHGDCPADVSAHTCGRAFASGERGAGIGLDDRGRLVSLENRLTGETFTVSGDDIAIEGVGFDAAGTDAVVKAVERTDSVLTVRAQSGPVEITTVWSLGAGRNFAEKIVSLSFDRDCGLKWVELGRLMFAGESLDIVAYRHPDLDWVADYVMARHGWDPRRPADSEPSTTFFGRTDRGGFFTGVEMPYDTSRLVDRAIVLGFTPHARVKAGEQFSCPPVYLGVSRKSPDDAGAADWGPVPAAAVAGRAKTSFEGAAAGLSGAKHEGGPAAVAATAKVRPLPSESRAMVAMTSRILGPPRHGVVALACGWHCQMQQDAYDSGRGARGRSAVAGVPRSLRAGRAHRFASVGRRAQKMAALARGGPTTCSTARASVPRAGPRTRPEGHPVAHDEQHASLDARTAARSGWTGPSGCAASRAERSAAPTPTTSAGGRPTAWPARRSTTGSRGSSSRRPGSGLYQAGAWTAISGAPAPISIPPCRSPALPTTTTTCRATRTTPASGLDRLIAAVRQRIRTCHLCAGRRWTWASGPSGTWMPALR